MEDLYVAGNPYNALSNPKDRKMGDNAVHDLMQDYDVFCDQLATFILSLTHAIYYEPNTLRYRPTKILEPLYQKAINLCKPIKTQFENELLEEYQLVDMAKKVLKGDFGR